MNIQLSLRRAPSKKLCRAYADNSNARCTKRATLFSKYCVHHIDKEAPFIFMIVGIIVGYLLTEFILKAIIPSQEQHEINKLTKLAIGQADDLQRLKRKPILIPYINGIRVTHLIDYPPDQDGFTFPVSNATIISLESTSITNELRLSLRNEGNIPADRVVLLIQYQTHFTNIVKGDQWEDGYFSDTNYLVIRNESRNLVPSGGLYWPQAVKYHRPSKLPMILPLIVRPYALNSDNVYGLVLLVFQ